MYSHYMMSICPIDFPVLSIFNHEILNSLSLKLEMTPPSRGDLDFQH